MPQIYSSLLRYVYNEFQLSQTGTLSYKEYFFTCFLKFILMNFVRYACQANVFILLKIPKNRLLLLPVFMKLFLFIWTNLHFYIISGQSACFFPALNLLSHNLNPFRITFYLYFFLCAYCSSIVVFSFK